MDYCHCSRPELVKSNQGECYCQECGLWYDEESWKKDPRVGAARYEARQFTKEQENIVNNIIKNATKEKP